MLSFWDVYQCVWIDVIAEKHPDGNNLVLKVCKRSEEGSETCVTGFIQYDDMKELIKHLEEVIK